MLQGKTKQKKEEFAKLPHRHCNTNKHIEKKKKNFTTVLFFFFFLVNTEFAFKNLACHIVLFADGDHKCSIHWARHIRIFASLEIEKTQGDIR